jgi:hypothetical protein
MNKPLEALRAFAERHSARAFSDKPVSLLAPGCAKREPKRDLNNVLVGETA